MRAVIQRVSRAEVRIAGAIRGKIEEGLVVFLGIAPDDQEGDIDFLVRKIKNLRVFSDKDGKFNLSLQDKNGKILLISQFTLFGDCRRGNRPSFSRAAPPAIAETLYRKTIKKLEDTGMIVASGVFGTHMEVELINDGPVTLILDSKKEVY